MRGGAGLMPEDIDWDELEHLLANLKRKISGGSFDYFEGVDYGFEMGWRMALGGRFDD